MSDNWQKTAVKVGRMIRDASKRYPELNPLHSSFLNFARKHHVQQLDAALLEVNGMVILPVAEFERLTSNIRRQNEEIRALEYRISTLLEPQ